jgi:peptide subunit release factor 1 (eRF1)
MPKSSRQRGIVKVPCVIGTRQMPKSKGVCREPPSTKSTRKKSTDKQLFCRVLDKMHLAKNRFPVVITCNIVRG